jgi:hypothetical protein
VSTPASPVITAPELSIPGSGVAFPFASTIYTVQAGVPERIESVYMVATFPENNETKDIFTIQLCDQTGVVLYEQATPPLLGVDSAALIAFLTWSRLGNDTAQIAAPEQVFAVDGLRRAWLNMRLPDLVLQNSSTVVLNAWFDDGSEASPVDMSQIAVTVTRNAGAVSTTTAVDILPLLVPTTSS